MCLHLDHSDRDYCVSAHCGRGKRHGLDLKWLCSGSVIGALVFSVFSRACASPQSIHVPGQGGGSGFHSWISISPCSCLSPYEMFYNNKNFSMIDYISYFFLSLKGNLCIVSMWSQKNGRKLTNAVCPCKSYWNSCVCSVFLKLTLKSFSL